MNKHTPLTLFATYWNEHDWIEASLAQIDILNPREVIICDGCFDPRYPNTSTDGTRAIIQQWVANRPHARMVPALRMSRIKGLWYLFGIGMRWWNIPIRIALMCFYSRTNIYRINQACTFTYMLRTAFHNKPGDWIMHSDSDQFYSDAMIKKIRSLIEQSSYTGSLLTGKEITFFSDFQHCTDQYEKRNYNNMPYRMKRHLLIVPTRDVVIEQYPKPVPYYRDPTIQQQHSGHYFHYKFRPNTPDRVALGYAVGDRKMPSRNQFTESPFYGNHPTVIQKQFGLLRTNEPITHLHDGN